LLATGAPESSFARKLTSDLLMTMSKGQWGRIVVDNLRERKMKTRLIILVGTSLIVAATSAVVTAGDYAEAWQKGGFSLPESVSYDPQSKSLFVSNINSLDFSPNGKGYISQLTLGGDVTKEKFVDGLGAPKGTDVSNGKLFVATAGELIEIDISSGKVSNRYPAPDSGFFNDVAAGPDGRVFVSDTMQSAVYVLENGKLTKWLVDPMLEGANGLFVDGTELRVATMDMSAGFPNMKPRNVKSVNLQTKQITDYGSAAPIGVLDGLEPMGADQGLMVTDNAGGRLIQIKSDRTITTLLEVGAGAADFEYIPSEHLVVIPNLQTGEVTAYKTGG
jgi:hypothetical protein